MVELRTSPSGITIGLHVQPKASRERLAGEHAGRLKLAVTAAPEKGKANQAVIRLLAKALTLKRSQLSLVSGETSRDKTVLITGLTESELRDKLKPFLPSI